MADIDIDAMRIALDNERLAQSREPSFEEMQASLTPSRRLQYAGKRAQVDTEPAYKAPLALARGWAAGTAGLPGDLEKLARMAGAVYSGAKKGTLYDETVDTTPVLPTSEFYKEWLPGKDTNPYASLLTDVGGLAGGMGSSQVGKAGVAVGKLGAEAINAGMQGEGLMSKVLSPIAPAYAVKPSGNLNLQPGISAKTLKGPDTQTLDDFLKQVSGTPGITAEGIKQNLGATAVLNPATKMTKAEFEAYIAPSKYEKFPLSVDNEGMLQHYTDEALNIVHENPAHLGNAIDLPPNLHRELDDLRNNDFDIENASPLFKRWLNKKGITDSEQLADEWHDAQAIAVEKIVAERAAYEGDVIDTTPYRDVQRLFDWDTEYNTYNPEGHTYFAIGVKHPDQYGTYRHSPSDQGTIGHFRGSLMHEPVLATGDVTIPEGAFLVEEIQSDIQQTEKMTRHLHQVHGTVAKAAIQHALEQGATSIYMPSSTTVGRVRDASDRQIKMLQRVYDREVIKEAINPLKKIPGVSVTGVGKILGDVGDPPFAYQVITFTPEARDSILKGAGQLTPGMRTGGEVSQDAMRMALSANKVQHKGAGGIIKKAAQIIGKAAESAGMARPVTATKDLTTLQDFHTSLGDRVRQAAIERQDMIESTPFLYDKGQRVFTKSSSDKNRPPYTILDRTLVGNDPMRSDHPQLGPNMGKVMKDPQTGKTMRTSREPGYRVRQELGPDDWQEFNIPESAILGDVEMARGGIVRKAKGGEVSQDAMRMAVWKHPVKREVGGEAKPTLEEMQAALTPYVGNFYTGKRAKKDTVPAYKAPLALARGWAAGTAGLPGDLEQLARTVGAVHSGAKKGTLYDETVDTTPFLPTSDFYKEYLPFKDNNPYSELLTDVGGLAGGMGSSQVGKAGVAVGKLGAEAINAGMQGEGLMGKVLAPVAPMNVIKQKGGNWIAGSVDQMLDPLKTKTAGGMDPAEALRELTEVYPPSQQNFSNLNPILKESVIRRTQWLEKNAALNSFVDKQMTRYVKNEMATPEDPIRLMAEAWPAQQAKLLESKQVQIDKAVSDMEKARQSRGFTPEMMTSSQARIRDLEKEKELIERQVGLHTDPEQLNIRPDMLVDKFLQQGQKILGKSPTAKAWEGASDLTVNSQIAKDYLDARSPTNAFFGTGNQISATNKALKENPWLSKVDPMTPVYYQQGYVDDIKFDHIIDELRNATNPASGLPKSLQIEAKDLAKYSMPQAVERVDKINAWRASQKAEVDTNRANNAATFTVKEYPDGVSWKELKLPEVPTELPSQYEIVGDLNSGFKYRRKTPDRYGSTQESPPFDTAEEAQAAALSSKSVRSASLEDALAYEGELAKHCVSGYCPDVESGKSQVFSLRDKGVPQVTIEVQPGSLSGKRSLDEWKASYAKNHGAEQVEPFLAEHPEIAEAFRPMIAQIKGIKNHAPAAKYLPMVQDFIKSGKWSEIKDLENARMFHAGDGVYITDAEAALIKKEKGLKRGGVVSQDAMQFAVMDKQLRKRNG